MCESCSKLGFDLSVEQFQKMKFLTDMNQRFWQAGKTGDCDEMSRLVKEGLAAGMRPIDMLFGFAGPSLVRVGELWAENALTVADEHRFTETCYAFVDLISQHVASQMSGIPSGQRVLLINVEGNQHVLGLRFFSLGLAGLGVPCKILLHSTAAEAVKTALTENFGIIGLTIGLPEQALKLKRTIETFLAEPQFSGQILVGGAAVNSGLMKPSQSDRVHMIARPVFNREEWNSLFKVG